MNHRYKFEDRNAADFWPDSDCKEILEVYDKEMMGLIGSSYKWLPMASLIQDKVSLTMEYEHY